MSVTAPVATRDGQTKGWQPASYPRISIVTACYNAQKYIGETLQSIADQNYPNLEHIVIDGASKDGTLDIVRRYPNLKVVSEPDKGHGDAVNKGFAMATGDIYGFVNADDCLLPGALHRVANEIDPSRGRNVVMGRCVFTDENSHSQCIEHPCHFESHRRLLQIWKGHMIPQPSTFFIRKVWDDCGPMLINLWLDYDFFIRVSKKYRFHRLDQLLATYRLHSDSFTVKNSEADRLNQCIEISKRYWGSPLLPKYWSLAASLGMYRLDRVGRGRRSVKRADELWRNGNKARAIALGLGGSILAPEILFYVKMYPWLRKHLLDGVSAKAVDWLLSLRKTYPQTDIYMNHVEPFGDGWVGPRLVIQRQVASDARALVVRGETDLTYFKKPQAIGIHVDGRDLGRHPLTNGHFAATIPLDPPIAPGSYQIEIVADAFFVPHRYLRNQDYRPLAWRLQAIELN